MKKGISIFLCLLLLLVMLVGCGNADEYNQKLYDYYAEQLILSEDYIEGMNSYIDLLESLQKGGLNHYEVASSAGRIDNNLNLINEVLDDVNENFMQIKNPPSQCKEGFEIAQRVYDALNQMYTLQEVSIEDSEADSEKMQSYITAAQEYYANYLEALVELGDYFEEIGFEPSKAD